MSLTLLPFNEYPHGANVHLHMEHPESHASKCIETLQCYMPVLDYEHTFVSLFLESIRSDHPRRDLCHHVLHVFGLAHIDRICFRTVLTILDSNVSDKVRDACLSQHQRLAQCGLRLVSHCTTSAAECVTPNGKPLCDPAPPPPSHQAAAQAQSSRRPAPGLRVIVSRPQSNPPPSHARPNRIRPLQQRPNQRAKSNPSRKKRGLQSEQPSHFLVVPPALSFCSPQQQQPEPARCCKRAKNLESQTLSPPWQHQVSPRERQRLHAQQHITLADRAFRQQPISPLLLHPHQAGRPPSAFDAAMPLHPQLGSPPPATHRLRRSAPRIESSLHRALAGQSK